MSVTLSIIIVNYNGGVLLERCLAAIHDHPPGCDWEVILIDNGSGDGSADPVPVRYPAVRLVRLGENIGLARAFNRALTLARGELVLSLDSDTRVLPGTLVRLVERAARSPRHGVIGAALLNPDLTPQQTARRAPSALNAIFGRRSLITRWFPGNPISRRYLMAKERAAMQPYDVDWVSAAALLTRRKVVDAVGGLDEGFFVYWVDADYCARVRHEGWAVESLPDAAVIHQENLSSGHRTRRRTRMIADFHRGAYRYYRKHHVGHALSTRHAAAVVGLGTRALILIVWDYLTTTHNQLRLRWAHRELRRARV